MDFNTIEARVDISPSRHWLALGALVGLCALLLSTAFVPGASTGGRMVLLGSAGLAALMAWTLLRHGRQHLILTEAGIVDGSGRTVCPLEDVASVNRSAFAFKPSKGFVVHLKRSARAGWHPGLWWRFGRRLGIGGLVSGQQTRTMADLLILRLNAPALEGRL